MYWQVRRDVERQCCLRPELHRKWWANVSSRRLASRPRPADLLTGCLVVNLSGEWRVARECDLWKQDPHTPALAVQTQHQHSRQNCVTVTSISRSSHQTELGSDTRQEHFADFISWTWLSVVSLPFWRSAGCQRESVYLCWAGRRWTSRCASD